MHSLRMCLLFKHQFSNKIIICLSFNLNSMPPIFSHLFLVAADVSQLPFFVFVSCYNYITEDCIFSIFIFLLVGGPPDQLLGCIQIIFQPLKAKKVFLCHLKLVANLQQSDNFLGPETECSLLFSEKENRVQNF